MNLSDSDNDDDDVLLQTSSFGLKGILGKVSRTEENKKRKQTALLDDAIYETNRQIETKSRIVKIKQEVDNENVNISDTIYSSNDHNSIKERATAVITKNNIAKTQQQQQQTSASSSTFDDNILSSRQQEELQEAFDTDLTSCWGGREIIQFNVLEAQKLGYIFTNGSINHAINVLEKSCKKTSSSSMIDVQFVREAILLFRTATQYGCIDEVLCCTNKSVLYKLLQKVVVRNNNNNNNNNKLDPMKQQQKKYLPEQLHTWLLIAAYTSDTYQSLQLFSNSACTALLNFYIRGCIRITYSFQESITKFIKMIQLWIHPICSSSSSSTTTTRIASHNEVDGAATTKENVDLNHLKCIKNIGGLTNLLLIWEQEIQYFERCKSVIDIDSLTQCLIVINKISLDTCIQSNQIPNDIGRTIQNIRVLLLNALQNIYPSTVKEYSNCISAVAKKSFDGLQNLPIGIKYNIEDKNDTNGWLCHSTMIRNTICSPLTVHNNKHRITINQYKVRMCVEGLGLCLNTKCTTEETIIQHIIDMEPTTINIDWFTSKSTFRIPIAVTMYGFINLCAKLDTFKDVPSRFLATVEILCFMYEAGINIISLLNTETEVSEFGTTDDCSKLRVLVQYIQKYVIQVQKYCSRYANQPHMRRSDFILRVFHQYIIFTISRLSQAVGEIDTPLVQSSIATFFDKAENDDNNNNDDSDEKSDVESVE